VDVATGVWASSPQRAAMAVDRLMALRLVSAAAIARWVRAQRSACCADNADIDNADIVHSIHTAPSQHNVVPRGVQSCRFSPNMWPHRVLDPVNQRWKEGPSYARRVMNPKPRGRLSLIMCEERLGCDSHHAHGAGVQFARRGRAGRPRGRRSGLGHPVCSRRQDRSADTGCSTVPLHVMLLTFMLHLVLVVDLLHVEHVAPCTNCQPSVRALTRPTMCRQDEADDVAAYSAVLAEKEAAAQSAADYAARKQREVDDARAAELPAGVSIGDMENGAGSQLALFQRLGTLPSASRSAMPCLGVLFLARRCCSILALCVLGDGTCTPDRLDIKTPPACQQQLCLIRWCASYDAAAQRAASEAAAAQDLVARDQQELERRRLAHRAAQREQQVRTSAVTTL